MDFFASKANSFLSGKTDDSQPENENKNQKPHHPQPSNSDLLSSAQLVADAAKSSFGGESDKVDKGKVAGAGADLLDAASKYGNLEGKSFGKYVDKAEDYLHQYHTSHSTTTTTTTNDFGHSTTETETTTTTTTTDSGKSATETTTPPTTTDLPAKTGGDGGSEGGYGDYLKMAEGFLKKH